MAKPPGTGIVQIIQALEKKHTYVQDPHDITEPSMQVTIDLPETLQSRLLAQAEHLQISIETLDLSIN